MSRFEDEDGIDGPFERALRRAEKEDARPGKRFEVRVRVAASQGGDERTISVRVAGKACAITAASAELDRQGIDHWTLISCSEATS